MNLSDSDPAKITTNGVEACFTIMQELLKALEGSIDIEGIRTICY